jgi:hypothetical protein
MAKHGKRRRKGKDFSWTPSAVRKRLREAQERLDEMSACLAEQQTAQRAAHLRDEVERLLAVFDQTTAVSELRIRLQKRRRREEWWARRQARAREARAGREAERALWDRLVAEWQALFLQKEREREEARRAARRRNSEQQRERELSKKDEEFNCMLAKLELLRNLRRQRLVFLSGETEQDRLREQELRELYASLQTRTPSTPPPAAREEPAAPQQQQQQQEQPPAPDATDWDMQLHPPLDLDKVPDYFTTHVLLLLLCELSV